MAKRKRSRRSFGAIRELPSGNFQASFVHPISGRRVLAPYTFTTKFDADSWLSVERARIIKGDFAAPQKKSTPLTFGEFAPAWLADRDLTAGTRAGYESILDNWLLPTFKDMPLTSITKHDVDEWHRQAGNRYPTARANAYTLLNSAMRAALERDLIAVNPCHIKGAGNPRTRRQGELLTAKDLHAIAAKMPEQYRIFALVAGYGALRIGEAAGLQVGDFDLANNEVNIRRASTDLGPRVGATKTAGSNRTVALPRNIMAAVIAHIDQFCEQDREAWLFPSPMNAALPVQPQVLRRYFILAAERANLPKARPHDLRRTGATMAAQAGATTREVMARLGHTSATVAMRYQLTTRERDRALAEKLERLDREP